MLNIEKYKDEIIEMAKHDIDFTVTKKGDIVACFDWRCDECKFFNNKLCCECAKTLWLFEEYKEKIKLTQFEYDLLLTYDFKDCGFDYFCSNERLIKKGYFKGVEDTSMTIQEILDNCIVEE